MRFHSNSLQFINKCLFAAGCCLLTYSCQQDSPTLGGVLGDFGVGLSADLMVTPVKEGKIALDRENDIAKLNFQNSLGRWNIRVVANLSRASELSLLQKEREQLESIYQQFSDPYFYANSGSKYTCAREYVLKEEVRGQENFVSFDLFATDRFILGACTKDTARFAVKIELIYCDSQRNFVRVERYTPISDLPNPSPSLGLRCLEKVGYLASVEKYLKKIF